MAEWQPLLNTVQTIMARAPVTHQEQQEKFQPVVYSVISSGHQEDLHLGVCV
jgi:hypothetical protein